MPADEAYPVTPCTLQGVTVTLGGVPVLRHLDLAIPDGDFLVVLGANGSGKSTLLRACLGLVPVTTGEVRLFGTQVASFRQWSRIAYAPQQFPDCRAIPVSVSEFIASGQTGPSIVGRRNRAALQHATVALGLWDLRRRAIGELSGGQQRRCLVARALGRMSDLLFLDEPTAGVDEEGQHLLAAVLRSRRDEGGTTVVVTHEHNAVSDLATRCLVVEPTGLRYC
ncbi:MAG: metal ABC transporter ATP-binding protein [Actinomycetales bacterium]|nr:metal ABC transporter ATP-binding protein [Actinomycetales bacterium]